MTDINEITFCKPTKDIIDFVGKLNKNYDCLYKIIEHKTDQFYKHSEKWQLSEKGQDKLSEIQQLEDIHEDFEFLIGSLEQVYSLEVD